MIHTFLKHATVTLRLLPSSWTREPDRARQNLCGRREQTQSVAAQLRDTSFASKVVWLYRSLRFPPNIASRAYQESRGLSRRCCAGSDWLPCNPILLPAFPGPANRAARKDLESCANAFA